MGYRSSMLTLGFVALAVIAVASYAIIQYSAARDPRPRPLVRRPEAPVSTAEPVTAPADPELLASEDEWFRDVTERTGIDFVHNSGTSAEKPFPAANGSGIGALDYDLDGHYDLYFATGTPFPLDETRLSPVNRLYRNLGAWRFENVSTQTGLAHNGYSAGVAVGDFNNDGFADVYVTCYGPNCLFQNQGDGTFKRIERAADVADDRWGTGAAFADVNQDGLLDLYVCNYGKWSWETNRFCGDHLRNVRLFCSPTTLEADQDVLYLNLGDGTFADISQTSGVAAVVRRGMGVVATHLNDDAAVDLYVTNDLHPNTLLLGRGDGTFEDWTEASGAGYDQRGRAQAGMGVSAADVDRDGLADLLVTNFEGEHNTLYQNMGDSLFQDTSHRTGLAADSLAWVGWGTALADFDLDTLPDAIVTNGHVDDNRHLLGQPTAYEAPCQLWHNRGGRFDFVGASAGSYFQQPHVGRALSLADLDNDGDYDVVIGHQDAGPAVLENLRPAPAHAAVVFRLVGTQSCRDAVGSRVMLRQAGRTIVEQVQGGGSYLSAHDLRGVMAVPHPDRPCTVEIIWPSGLRSQVTGCQAGHRYTVVESSAATIQTRLTGGRSFHER